MSSPRFTEKEVAAILQRAAELQVTAPGTRSVSLEELEHIAVEAGMDASLVRRAAQELSRGEAGADKSWLRTLLGGPTSLKWEFEIEGEIDATGHERILEAIHSTLSEPGNVSTTGRTLTWNIVSQSRKLGVTVTPKNGRTLVRVEDHLGNLMGGVFGGVGGGVGGSVTPFLAIAGGAVLGPVGVGIAVAAGLLGTLGGTRAIYGAVTRKREERLTVLVDSIREAVERSIDRGGDPARAEGEGRAAESALAEAKDAQGLKPAPDAVVNEVATESVAEEEPR